MNRTSLLHPAAIRYLDLMEQVLTGTITQDPPMDPWSRHGKYDPMIRQLGRDWPKTAFTMIGLSRLRNIRELMCRVIPDVPGDFLEAGVWRGGACIYMRAILEVIERNDRKVWVADSFEGLPPPSMPQDAGDIHYTFNELAVSETDVKKNFTRFDLFDDRVEFVPGWFKDTFPRLNTGPLAILRVDCDMYESTTTVLNSLYDRVSPGGFIIMDDWGAVPASYHATTDFFKRRDLSPCLHHIDGMGVYWQKE